MHVKAIGGISTVFAMSLLLPFGLYAGELPDGFRQVSYIQSSGTQHIDIDYAQTGRGFVAPARLLPQPTCPIAPFYFAQSGMSCGWE